MRPMDRTQFTFYGSFARAISRIRKKADKADAYDAIVNYALYGIEPDLEHLPDSVAIAFDLAKPNLDSSRKKAEGGKKSRKHTDNTTEASCEDGDNMPVTSSEDASNKKKKEKEDKKENKIENECYTAPACELKTPGSCFTDFWDAYPNPLNREKAWNEWKAINPDQETVAKIFAGLEAWKKSSSWVDDGPRYIPCANNWLHDKRWQIEPPAGNPKKDIPKGASGVLGEAELEAIQKALRYGGDG